MAGFMKRVRNSRLLLLLPLLVLLSACGTTVGIFAGGTWQASALQNQNIRALAVNPNNLQDIYAGDAQNGVFTTTNAGQNWVQDSAGLPVPTGVNALAFDDAGKKLYAATGAGLYASVGGTQHWSNIAGPGSGLPAGSFTSIAFDLNSASDIYVVTARHGVFKSANNGASWSNISAGLPTGDTINDLVYDPNTHQLWAATDMGVYQSGNGGSGWRLLNNGIPSSDIINTILPADVSGGAAGLIYAGTDHGFYLSTDSGAHWSQSKDSLLGIGVHAILIDYSQATTVYIATDIGVLRSADSGQTWGGIASGIPTDQAVYALAQGASGYSQLYAAARGIYFYPGSSGPFSIDRLIPILVILLFFYLLFVLISRGRRRSRGMLKPERIVERSPESLEQYRAVPEGTIQSKNGHMVSPGLEVGEQGNEYKDAGEIDD